MANNRNATPLAKKLILEYLKQLSDQKSKGIALSPDDKKNISQKKLLIEAIYKKNTDIIVESNLASPEDKDSKTAISYSTFQNAISALESERKIEKKLGSFHYIQAIEDRAKSFPILNIASHLKITPLDISDITFYRTSTQYASWIADYINSQFDADDIHAVAINDMIMCLDFAVPASAAAVTKKYTLRERIDNILQDFDFQSPKQFDDKNGLNAQELQALEEKQARKRAYRQRKEDETLATAYGGEIKNKPARKFKITKKASNT